MNSSNNLNNIYHRSVLLCLLLIITPGVKAQSFQRVVYDHKQSEHFGADNLVSLHKVLFLFQDRLIPDTLFRERNFWLKVPGFAYRMARLWLFDSQIDYIIALTQHEVFGHGSRFREAGYSDNSYHLSLYFPFGKGHGYARTGQLKAGSMITAPEYIAGSIGGNEANLVLSREISSQILLNNTIHYRQAMLYLISQNNQLAYIWYTRLSKKYRTGYSNDISSYVLWTNSLYHGRGPNYTVKSLSEQSLVSLANPLQLYAAYTILVKYGVQGKKRMNHIPMIPLGKPGYLPAFNYSLTPFGAQFHWINYLRFRKMLFTVEFLCGDSRFRQSYGFGFGGYNMVNIRWLSINALAEIWNQPELNLESYTPQILPARYGGKICADINIRPLKLPQQLGLFLQIGYKSKGYSMGEPLDKSIILRYGISAHFD